MICAMCERGIAAGEEVVVIAHVLATDLEESARPACAGHADRPFKPGSVKLVYGRSCCNPLAMALYLKKIHPLLGEIFFALVEGVDDLVKAANEEYHCPKCEEPLDGEFLHIEGLYTGVRLVCPSCGPIEYLGGSDDVW